MLLAFGLLTDGRTARPRSLLSSISGKAWRQPWSWLDPELTRPIAFDSGETADAGRNDLEQDRLFNGVHHVVPVYHDIAWLKGERQGSSSGTYCVARLPRLLCQSTGELVSRLVRLGNHDNFFTPPNIFSDYTLVNHICHKPATCVSTVRAKSKMCKQLGPQSAFDRQGQFPPMISLSRCFQPFGLQMVSSMLF